MWEICMDNQENNDEDRSFVIYCNSNDIWGML